LSNKCFACHGPSDPDRKGDLRLDLSDGEFGALTPREDSFVIKPGDLEASELWRRITTVDENDRMPPGDSHKEPLTARETNLIKQWILDGAEFQPFWSFVAPDEAPLAPINNAVWGQSMIDQRIMARLEQEGFQPKEKADKRTLLRRVTFDLTGLPPTLEEIDAFLNDDRPDAYERLVDDLLQRETYGEHMARYWADLVRLADTAGMHKDFNRDFTTYRDWLIRSFNSNLPFDEFITNQLAGDLYKEPSQDELVASGFNRLHLIIDRGTALPEESLHKNIVDRVQAFGTVFLGLTVQCAQCHDHKYDPISQQEYFQLYGFFNNFSGEPETDGGPPRGLQPPFIHLTNSDQDNALDELNAERNRLEATRTSIEAEMKSSGIWPDQFDRVSVPWIWNENEEQRREVELRTELTFEDAPSKAIARFTGMSKAEVQINGISLGATHSKDRGVVAEVSGLLAPGKNTISASARGKAGFAFILEYEAGGESKTFTTSSDWEVRSSSDAPWQTATEIYTPSHESAWTQNTKPENIASLIRDIEAVDRKKKRFLNTIPAAMVMREKDPPTPTTMLIRGMYDSPGDPVERNTPAFLPPMKKKDGPYSRMDLANWLVDPDHPLTARVAVNRFWQQFFGVGLVKTSEDFGAQGEWPSHPMLLDDLALHFIESGWDVKDLVRKIVLSSTYKQSSDAASEEFRRDPDNRLLARGSRFRLDAEMIRDQILAVSGQLNRTMYGRSVKPPQPPGLWEMVSMAEPLTYVADTDDNVYRRSLYSYWRRAIPPPQMTIMNAPSREYCVARRERTNTPLQALLLMNEQEYFEAAKACVRWTLTEDTNVKEGLSRLYEKITAHQPSPDRLELLKKTLRDFQDIYKNDRALTEALTPELSDASFKDRVDLASWTMVTHGLMNLELAKVRN
jgi:hypothetical protein